MEADVTDLFDKCKTDGGSFGAYRAAGDEYFTRPMLDGTPGPHMEFQGKPVVMWAVNNYSGLCANEEVRKAALEAVEKWGTYSPMGSRLLTGNTRYHRELEAELAEFLDKPAAILFNYGYLGVLGTIAALTGPDDQVIIDRLSHACIVDGAMLASYGRRFRTFRHNSLSNLETILKQANKNRKGGILIVTEGVYGMRGDLADLKGICALKDEYGARLYVDDAHGFGVMGENGKGLGEHLGVQDSIDLYFGTFAKAFAAIGGVTAGPPEVIEWIRYNARTNVFAKALPMVYVAAVKKSLEIIRERGAEMRERMWSVAKRLQNGLVELGFDIGDTQSPITPVYVPAGDQTIGRSMISFLRENYGVFVSAVSYPVVPMGVLLFRMIPTASHTDEDVDRTIEAFHHMRDELKVDVSVKPSQQNK
jgi:glycine C-acetyltransferase